MKRTEVMENPYIYGKQMRRDRNLAKARNSHHNKIPHVTVQGIEKKSCGRCGSLKPLDMFHVDNHSWDKLHSICKDCLKKVKR